MTMTAGERAIWAAAFIASYNKWLERAVHLDSFGAPQQNERAAARAPMMAATEAASLVNIVRETLTKMAAAEIKPGHEQRVTDAITMLRDMLGVAPDGNPYR